MWRVPSNMYKLALVFTFFGSVLSATLPQKDVSRVESCNLSKDGTNTLKSRQVFTIKISSDGAPLQQCQCREFHLCDQNDIYDPSLTQDWIRCENKHICCILKNISSSVVDSTSPPNNIQRLADSPGQLFDATKPTNSAYSDDSKTCICVPFAKCSDESYVNNYGQGTIGISIRVQQCDISEVCCPVAYIKSKNTKTETSIVSAEFETTKPALPSTSSEQSPEPVATVIPPTTDGIGETSSSSSVQSTVAILTEQLFTPTQLPQSQCSCVPIDSCKNDSITNNHGAGVLQIRAPFCDVSEVCCLVSDVVAVSASITPITADGGNSSEQECGLRKEIRTRISGAEDETYTNFGEFPWMMMILRKDVEHDKPVMICCGSLVSPNTVLTAAHCIHNIDKKKLIVRAGEYDFDLEASQEKQPHQDMQVRDIRIHPFYREDVVFNDMALLIMDNVFKLKAHISPICLPFLNSKFAEPEVYNPTKCIATGWGTVVHGDAENYRNTLKKVDLSLIDHYQCENRLRKTQLGSKFILHSSFICAGGEVGKDTCQGDGGGPLFCALRDHPSQYVQVGITSWGVGCGKSLPGVYTNVYANSKWLTVEINMSRELYSS